jgi:hypothetical protein
VIINLPPVIIMGGRVLADVNNGVLLYYCLVGWVLWETWTARSFLYVRNGKLHGL